MELYDRKSKSIPQKIIINLAEIFLLWLSFWILFQDGGSWCEEHLKINTTNEYMGRRIIIFVFNMVIFIRIAFMMVFLLKRRITGEEIVSIPLAFAIYYVGFSLFVLSTERPVDALDYFAILLFVVGCVLNSGGEIMRHRWKQHPENKGKIYTGGFFKYSRHINFFGDIVWVTAYALVTKNWYAAFVPVLLFCFFAFYNAPKLDSYLRKKYGNEYDEYARRTRMLIPFVL